MVTRFRLLAALLCLMGLLGHRAFADGQMPPGGSGTFPVQGQIPEDDTPRDWGIYATSINEVATTSTPNGWSVSVGGDKPKPYDHGQCSGQCFSRTNLHCLVYDRRYQPEP